MDEVPKLSERQPFVFSQLPGKGSATSAASATMVSFGAGGICSEQEPGRPSVQVDLGVARAAGGSQFDSLAAACALEHGNDIHA